MTLPFQFKTKTIIAERRTNQKNIDTIKDWLITTTLPKLQEEFIVLFLLSCKNNINLTKQTIDSYFRIKNGAPQIFNNCLLDSTGIKNIMQVLGICVSPTRLDENSVVMCGKLLNTNYRLCDAINVIKLFCMTIHLCQMYDPPSELIVVADLTGVGFMHLTCIKMDAAIAYLQYMQEGVPLKIRAIHILNSNYVFDKALNLAKMFIKNELMGMLKIHPPGMDMQQFHQEYVPAKCLPKEYGGTLGPFQQLVNEFCTELEKMQPFFNAEEKLRSTYAAS